MKVQALHVDYDGTIAPLGVPRDQSRVLRGVEKELRRMALEIPVCVVTAKDYEFVHPRCMFATGWACASGQDVRLADGRVFTAKRLRDLGDALELAHFGEQMGSFTELKRGPLGELLGVGIDWTAAPMAGRAIVQRLKPLAGAGHLVAYDGNSTFADIYAAPPDKGKAVRLLNRALGGKSEVMFIGDSTLDNAAFREAEMAIGVAHGQPTEKLRCDYVVSQQKLDKFLRALYESGMEFTPSLPGVRNQGAR